MKSSQSCPLSTEEIALLMLRQEEKMTAFYNRYANDTTAVSLRSEFLNLLNDEHQLQIELSDEIVKRGWRRFKKSSAS
ncbi:MAG: spore coat protein [Oscillospiraceae bacterium]